ncbi:MAG: STAS domain-containing protein [Candidatus Cybelea sp.]
MMENTASGPRYIALSGEYDLARKEELSSALAAITSGTPVTIDMRQVTYIDSTFLTEVTAMRLRRQERPVILLGVAPNIARILMLAKLDRFFVFR